jgi:eukaryotic-like serine/threonine-protein kinase
LQQLQAALPVGSIVRERYLIEGLLGKGGYGSVYLVRDLRVKQNLFALKENHSPEKKDHERFLFEGELLTRLDHRALPRVYRVFEDDSHQRTFMLMDYIEGLNLERFRQRQLGNRMCLAQALSIMAPIVDALRYLHHQPSPVLHRDIKPSNIIVPASGNDAVLVDFGIAKEYAPDSTTTTFRTGSPGYAAPEQYSRGTSTRSDIYGLGATFYTLLTGALPADALFRLTTTGSGQPDPLESPHALNPAIPLPVAQAIQHAMSLNASERFATVEQFWRAFAAQEGWQPLRSPGAAPFVQQLPQSSGKTLAALLAEVNTPLPTAITPRDQARPRRFRRLILLLFFLALLLGSGAFLGIYYFSATSSGLAPRSHQPGSIVTAVTTGSTPISTARPSGSPRPTPIPTTRPAATPTAHPTNPPSPAPTAPPTPKPAPSPTPVLIPDTAGTYNGTIDDTTSSIVTGMALTIQQTINQGSISGYFSVNPPLVGDGSFTGTVNSTKYVQFVVQSYKGDAPLYFWGWVQADGSLKGNYCSINAQGRCDPTAGASGTWDVAKVASPRATAATPE